MGQKKGVNSKAEPDILILGASGQVGMELQRQLPEERIIPRAREMLDVTNHTAVTKFIEEVRPRIVVNAASTSPCKAVADPSEHWRVNTFAVDHLAKTCALNKVALIHLSTSDVFGRTPGEQPHVEMTPTSPVGEYASSKAAGEHAVLSLSQFPCQEFVEFQYWILRSSLLYGRPRQFLHNFLNIKLQRLVRSRTPVALPTEVKRSATYVPHLVQQIVWLLENYRGVPSGIYNVASGGDPSLFDLVQEARRRITITVSGELEECSREEYARTEQVPLSELPLNGTLNCDAWDNVSPIPLPDWRRGVQEFAREFR